MWSLELRRRGIESGHFFGSETPAEGAAVFVRLRSFCRQTNQHTPRTCTRTRRHNTNRKEKKNTRDKHGATYSITRERAKTIRIQLGRCVVCDDGWTRSRSCGQRQQEGGSRFSFFCGDGLFLLRRSMHVCGGNNKRRCAQRRACLVHKNKNKKHMYSIDKCCCALCVCLTSIFLNKNQTTRGGVHNDELVWFGKNSV